MSIEIVKLQARKVGEESKQYLLTAPKDLIEELGWKKGTKLIVRVMEVTVNGSKKKALVYHEP